MNTQKKKAVRFGLFLFIISALIISCNTTNPPTNPTASGSKGLSVTASTSTAGGNYAPKNVLAVWIENGSGQFVKSLAVYAAQRKYDLTRWQSASKGNVTDAATGATRSGYSSISLTWNGTDTGGNIVADGSYKLCFELTDKSSSGNYSSFNFTKGATEQTLTPANVPSFSNITIKWSPL